MPNDIPSFLLAICMYVFSLIKYNGNKLISRQMSHIFRLISSSATAQICKLLRDYRSRKIDANVVLVEGRSFYFLFETPFNSACLCTWNEKFYKE